MISLTVAQLGPRVMVHLADAALRSIVLACLAALLLLAFRVRHVTVQLAVWTAVLYAALAMPVLAWLLPAIPVHLRIPAKEVAANPIRSSLSAGAPDQTEVFEVAVPSGQAVHAKAATRSERRVPWAPSTLALAIYAFGVVFLLGRLAMGLFLSRRLRRSSIRVDDPRALRWLEWYTVAMGPKRVPVLAESPAVSVPLTLGVLHPVILIPSGWREWQSAKVAAVIAHEVSHVKRNDSRTRALALIYRCFFWFSPLGWWLERHLANLAEQASDQAALRAGTEPIYYAEVLMSFFGISNGQGRVNWQGVSMARGLRARKRIERVLSSGATLAAGTKTPMLVLLGLCALPLVCLTAAMRPLLVAGAASTTSAPQSEIVARLQLPEPPPPVAPVAPAAPTATPPVPAAPPVPTAAEAGLGAMPAPAAPVPPPAPLAPEPPQAAPTASVRLHTDPVSTFSGTWNLSDVQPANLRLPRYPGSTPAPENEVGLRTVRLQNCSVADLTAARYVTNDSPQKVLSYYSEKMKPYGPVIQCNGGENREVYVELDGEALSNPRPCRPGEVGAGATELKVADDGTQEIMAVKARGGGSEFALVHVRAGSQPSGPNASVGQVYEHLKQLLAAQPGPASASALYGELLAQSGPAYAKAAKTYRNYSQSGGTTVTNSEENDENWTFSDSREGMDFAIVSGKSVMMFGSGDDRDEVRSLQKKIGGDFIWFIHNGNAYVIRDASTVKSAQALFGPMEELGRKQEELGRQQEELGKQQEALGKQQGSVRVTVPGDLEARLKRVEAEIRELGPSATQDDLGRIQGELGDLQGYVGDLQGKAGEQQGELGSRQGELGAKQGELGNKQGELGEEQGRIAREGARKMQGILKRALDSGLAQRAPE